MESRTASDHKFYRNDGLGRHGIQHGPAVRVHARAWGHKILRCRFPAAKEKGRRDGFYGAAHRDGEDEKHEKASAQVEAGRLGVAQDKASSSKSLTHRCKGQDKRRACSVCVFALPTGSHASCVIDETTHFLATEAGLHASCMLLARLYATCKTGRSSNRARLACLLCDR